VVLGDFNEGCEGLAVGYLLENGYADAMRVYEQAKASQSPTTMAVWDSVDHILFSQDFECYSADMLDRGGSDHQPVVAVLGRRVR
jgi:endonuclease/exonuclease/phosphatase family metal-dependent hydrolase